MSWAREWLERSDWAKHTGEFTDVVITGPRERRRAGMIFGADESTVRVSDPCWEMWRDLPAHPHVIPVIAEGVVEYAAIDWQPAPLTTERLATCGIDLVDLFEVILAREQERAGWLSCPIAKIDVQGELRVLFASPGRKSLPSSRLAPELVERWPIADDVSCVFSIGQALVTLGALENARLTPVVERCLEPNPLRRVHLDKLVKLLRGCGASSRVRGSLRDQQWQYAAIEQGLGLLALGMPGKAAIDFRSAISQNTTGHIALELNAIAENRGPASLDEPLVPNDPQKLYAQVYALADGKIARSRILVDQHPLPAVEEPTTFDGFVERDLRMRDYHRALARVDERLTTVDEPRVHHLRGKALLGLGRLADARTAFDLALARDPRLLEAMLLRREVDRVVSTARDAAGVATPTRSTIPDHLAELRDIFVAGRIVDAIQLLRRPAYDDDRTAQLLLAELFVTDGRLDDALVIFDRLDESLGKARTLLALDRADDALVALTSDADDALELRAKILLALNRGDEAERAMDAYLRAVERRSDRRVNGR